MKHRKYYGGFTRPPSDASTSDEGTISEQYSKRKANVYDAVAGRVTQAGFLGSFKDDKGSKQPLRPDEVLFKQANAPVRYEETDYYHAHATLPMDQRLPNGELLSALHAYISKLYSRTAEPGVQKAWECMDETALLALGLLMEETARELLGKTGDLAFTEAADEEEERALVARDDEAGGEKLARAAPLDGKTEEQRAGPWSSSDDGSRYATEDSE